MRWQHPTDGLLLPGSFLPLAEESALIVDVSPSFILQAGLPYGPNLSETTNGGRLVQQLHSPDPNPCHGNRPIICPRKHLHLARKPRRRRVLSLLTT